MWVLYQEYSAKYGNIENVSGAHIPTVVTLQKSNGQYELVEYWEAKDGTLYAPSIKEKFPLYLYGKATDSQRYIKQQQVACDMKAVKYFGDLPSFGGLTDFEPTVSYANWLEDSTIYIGALNRDKMYISSVQHLPIYKFDTLEDIQQFKKHFENHHSLDQGYNEVPSFNAATVNYDEVFFSKNSLLLVYVGASNSTHRFGVSCITRSDRSFYVQVGETTGAEAVDTAMAGWFITLAVADEVIKNCTDFDAVLYHDSEENLPVVEEELPEDALILMDLEILKLNWPMYFDLPTESGLEVYIWQTNENSYSCGLLPGRDSLYTEQEFRDLEKNAVALGVMQTIISYYISNGEVTKEEVTICPLVPVYSSRPMDYYETYQQELAELFWSGVPNADNPVMLTSLSYAKYTDDLTIYTNERNLNYVDGSDILFTPIYKFDTLEDLKWFKENIGIHYGIDQSYEEVPSFHAVIADYDEAFFDKNSLILVYIGNNNTTQRYAVQGIMYNEHTFKIDIKETTGAKVLDYGLTGWFVTVAVPDEMVKNCTQYYASIPDNDTDVVFSDADTILAPSSRRTVYVQTPAEEVSELIENEEFVYSTSHYQTTDGMWHVQGYDYLYRLEVTGRMNNAAKNTTYVILCNEEISFDQAWKASGLSSNTEDYFDPADAMIVGYRTFS